MTAVEICVADAEGVRSAAASGADRVELCSALEVGGLTPSLGTIEVASALAGEVFVTVLIRPRPGDFVYDPDEVATMTRDVQRIAGLAEAARLPGLGFTIGALTPQADLDDPTLARLLDAARGRPVVFHKAFDSVPRPERTLERLAELGFDSVLTAGGGGACTDHLDALRAWAAGPLPITAAGGVRPGNVRAVASTGVARVHLRAPRWVPSASAVASAYDADDRQVTDPALVAQVVALLREGR